MELDAAVKHADAEVLEMISGMPDWVDTAKLEAEYGALKSKAAAPKFPSPFYPAPAAAATVTAANMKILHTAYAKSV